MVSLRLIKQVVRTLLFILLLVAFYFMYMKDAVEQFNKKSTTFAQETRNESQLEPPILVACPDPPLKPSFFKSCRPIYLKFFKTQNTVAHGLIDKKNKFIR